MTKRILSIFTTLIMAVSFAGGVPAITAGALTYGDYIYEILYDGTVDITDYKGSETTLAIPSTIDGKIVTRIRGHAFEYHVSLTNVTIPDSITSIGSFAFHHCTNLTNVVIPSSVTGIGECAFWGCSSLSEITVPNSVEEIGPQAFCGCISLKAVTIPGSVTAIESDVFSNCDELTEVTISDDVQSIGNRAFEYCTSLKEVTIPSSVRSIGDETFRGCSSLSMVTIPGLIGYHAFYDCTALNSVVISKGGEIGQGAFGGCSGLNTLIISDKVTKIKWNAFYGCTSLTDVYYSGSKEQWDKIDIYSGNDCLTNSIIHYDSIGETDLPNSPSKQLYFVEPIAILDVGEARQLVVHSRDVSNVNGELVYSNDQVMDNNELVWNSTNYKDNSIIELSDTGEVTAISNGIEYVSVHSKDDISLGTSCHIFVGKPNEFSYTATYDTKQYYAEGGFFSEKSSVSDCVEIYMLLENKLTDELKDLTGIEDKLNSDDAQKDIDPITLTATVNGNDLSFSRDTYTNTYSTTFDALSVGKAVDDVLMLFPTDDINIASSGNTYTVKVTLQSESFDTVTEEYTFTIENLETKSANEHITFTTSNADYKVSKNNFYGQSMVTLKNDAEYKWSKYSTFDFKNYHQIVLADIMINMLDANQVELPSLIPSYIKEWTGTYKTLLGGISTIVEDDYTGMLDISDTKIDKLLKKSKYTTDGVYSDDELYQTVLNLIGNANNAEKITKVFATVDKTQKVFGFVKLGKNILKDAIEWGNKISLYNVYADADTEFKAVMKTFADSIPDSERKMKEAVYDYINYETDTSGKTEELLESFSEMFGNVTLDVFKSCIGKSLFNYLSINLLNWIGDSIILSSGAAFSTTAAFTGVQTAFGSFFTGASLGLCLSDVLCDSSGKAEEMSKVVAMSEFSPYIINTLNQYESKLYSDRSDNAVAEFEYAFALHKATQSYIMEHTIKALETKRDSIIIKLFSRDDYDELISDILAQKSAIDNLKCHTDIQESTVVNKTKVIAIKCPVDVYVYDENGKEIVRIVKDITEYVAEGINLFIEDGKKYIALPANQNYSLKIVATDKGEMEYRVTEYGDGVERLRTVTISKIPLITGRVFTGEIAESMEVSSDDYALIYANNSDQPSSTDINPNNPTNSSQNPNNNPNQNISTFQPTKSPNINIKSKSTLTTSTSTTTIKKAKVKNLKVKTKGKKITVSWKKIKIAKGYQVQVATNKKFKKKKIVFDKFTKKRKLIIKSSKIKRKKTYYVRVRAYATYKDKNGEAQKVYSKWVKRVRKVKVR